MSDFEVSKVSPGDMMSYYSQMCLPGNKNNPEHTTLINAALSAELAVAILAKLAEQDLIFTKNNHILTIGFHLKYAFFNYNLDGIPLSHYH